jgi:hypothetical protein
MTLNNKIYQLPSEQLSWLLLTRDIFKRTFDSSRKEKMEFIDSVRMKAIERGFNKIVLMFDCYDFEEYYKN